MAKACPSLAQLNVRGCFSVVTDQALQQLTRSCKHIAVLNLGSSAPTGFCDCQLVSELGVWLTRVVCAAAECKYVTDRGLQAIASNLKGLATLVASGLPQITDKGITHLRTLRGLHLLNVRATLLRILRPSPPRG